MKKYIMLTLLCLFVFSSSVYSSGEALKVSGDVNYPPYEYLDENGVYKGFNVDIINAISIELGRDIVLEPMEWKKATKALKNNKIDAIQGIAYSEERSKYFDFTESIVENTEAIFVSSENEFVKNVQSLKGLKVSIQSEDIAYEKISKIEGIQIYEYDTQTKAVNALMDKKVDAFIGNRITALYYIQKEGFSDAIKSTGNVTENISYSIAVSKGDNDTLDSLNEGLRKIKKNGTYNKIYKKWFGEDIQNVGKWKNLFYSAITVLISISTLFLLVVNLNRILKKEVKKRTSIIEESKITLAQQNRLRGKIIENVNTGIIAFNPKGIVTNINQFALDIIGKEIQKGDLHSSIELIKDFDINILESKDAFGCFEKEMVWTNSDKNKFDLTYKIIPIYDTTYLEGFLLCISDLTEERALNQIAANNDKVQSIGILSAGIAHELRNPLTAISMFVNMIPNKHNDNSFLEKFMSVVTSELNRLTKLTSVLLDYSKPSKPEIVKLNFSEAIDNIYLLLKPYIKSKKINIIREYNNTSFLADPSQFKQIMLNILLNSVDAIVDTGEISISTIETDIDLIISVKDNGLGIKKENISKVFDPFFTSKKSGYGVGLSVTNKLVKENKGTIEIDSPSNLGTTVKLSFPKY